MNRATHLSAGEDRRPAGRSAALPQPSPLRAVPGSRFRRLASRCARLALATFLFLAAGWSQAADKAGAASEYQVKAAFLFNFVKFTEWPAVAFTNSAAPLVIGVLGTDPFGSALDDVVKGEVINGRSLVVKRFPSGDTPAACHVLFVSRSEKARLPDLRAELKQKPVLTVSDLDQFCQQGGMINLVLSAGGTVKPEINPEASRSAGLQISSKLLNLPLVRLVKTEN
jgi:hypothetical protein